MFFPKNSVGLAIALGLFLPLPCFAKQPIQGGCPNQSPTSIAQLASAAWIVEGKVIDVRSEIERGVGSGVGGDGEGSAVVRVAHILRGELNRSPKVVFRWSVAWSDSEPFETGLKPRIGDDLVVWSSANLVGYTLAACIS